MIKDIPKCFRISCLMAAFLTQTLGVQANAAVDVDALGVSEPPFWRWGQNRIFCSCLTIPRVC